MLTFLCWLPFIYWKGNFQDQRDSGILIFVFSIAKRMQPQKNSITKCFIDILRIFNWKIRTLFVVWKFASPNVLSPNVSFVTDSLVFFWREKSKYVKCISLLFLTRKLVSLNLVYLYIMNTDTNLCRLHSVAGYRRESFHELCKGRI